MTSQIILNLNKEVLLNAENYAKEHRTSISKIIENYLNSSNKKKPENPNITPLVESLTGIIKTDDTESETDERYEYLRKKLLTKENFN